MKLFITGGSGFIGTNFIEDLLSAGYEICNFDLEPPSNPEHLPMWQKGDILNQKELLQRLQEFKPDTVVHMAARTDTNTEEGNVDDAYGVNTRGSRSLLSCLHQCPCVKRLIVVSSQFVVGPGALPKTDTDFRPHTLYGQSKVITEKLTREMAPECTWTIVRPTNVWGPYHERYAREFWRILSLGFYLHPNCPSPLRSYGYVGNVSWQLLKLLEAPQKVVHKRVFYVGDRPIRIFRWIHGFHQALSPRKTMIKIPYAIMRILAKIGDGISFITRKPFFLNSSRLKSMSTDYPTDMEPIFSTFGEPPFSLEQGIEQTSAWYRNRKRAVSSQNTLSD